MRILYVTNTIEGAAAINSNNRRSVLTSIGHAVIVIAPLRHCVQAVFEQLRRTRYDMVYVRVDGSYALDPVSPVAWLYHIPVIWEVHGFYEENIFGRASRRQMCVSLIKNVIRWCISITVSGYVFVSDELSEYGSRKIVRHPSVVIANFHLHHIRSEHRVTQRPMPFSEDAFLVLWIGNGRYRWHALDMIETIAKSVYLKDKNVYFLLASNQYWHTFSWYKNIVLLNHVPSDVIHSYIRTSDIGLALYHASVSCPFYFSPMKIIDYMLERKPVIASPYGQINRLVVNGTTGFTETSVDAIVRNILFLKEHRSVKHTMGRSGYRHVMTVCNEATAKKLYRQFFSQFIHAKRKTTI